MSSPIKIMLSIALMFVGLSACSDDAKSNQDVHETFLQGNISGHLNGNAFSFGESTGRDSKIRVVGNQTSLVLTLGTNKYTGIIIIGDYQGEGKYQDEMSLSPFMLMTKPTDKFTTLEKTLNVTQDSEDKISGDFTFKVASATKEQIAVDGTFEYTKIIIDTNDDANLLSELKDNAALMKSLGNRRTDKDFVINAIKQNHIVFRYADEQLGKDKEFILQVLEEEPDAMPLFLMHADKELLQDKGFALKMMAINPKAMHLLDKELKKDVDIIAASKKD